MLTAHVAMSLASSCTDLRSLVDAAAHTGISRIHAHWWQLHAWLLQHAVDVTADVIDLTFGGDVRLSGIDVATLTIDCDQDFDERTDDAYMQMQVARKLGLSQVTVYSESRNAAAYDYIVAALLRLTTLAERLKLDILVGNRRGTCLEQIDDISRVIVDVGAHNLYVDLDVAELHLACVNPCDAFLAFGSRTFRVRLSNVDGGLHTALGEGEIAIPAVLRALQNSGLDCPFLLKLGDDHGARERLLADVRFLECSGYLPD